MTTDTIRLDTYQQLWLFQVAVRLSSLSAICLHDLQCRSHLSLDPLSVFLSALTSSHTLLWKDSSSSLPRRYQIANQIPFTTVLPLLYSPHHCLLFPISPCLKCGKRNVVLALYSQSTARTSNLPTYLPPSWLLRLVIFCWLALWY